MSAGSGGCGRIVFFRTSSLDLLNGEVKVKRRPLLGRGGDCFCGAVSVLERALVPLSTELGTLNRAGMPPGALAVGAARIELLRTIFSGLSCRTRDEDATDTFRDSRGFGPSMTRNELGRRGFGLDTVGTDGPIGMDRCRWLRVRSGFASSCGQATSFPFPLSLGGGRGCSLQLL